MRLTVLELPASWGAPDDVLDDVAARLAAGPASDLVLLPEAALHGYVSPALAFDPTPFAEHIDGTSADRCAGLARKHHTYLVAPLVLAEGNAVYNAMVCYGPDGDVAFVYRKRHPWFPETWATPGTLAPPLVSIGNRSVTIAICYDLHFLPTDADAELLGAKLLLFPSAWVEDPDNRIARLIRLAQRYDLHIANANWAPGDVLVPGQGDSCVIAPDGRILARAKAGGRIDIVLPPVPARVGR